MQHRISVLSNRLRVVSIILPHLHSLEISVYVKVGGRNDPGQRSGLSHFLEHMLFRGTEEYASSLEIEAAFEELGGAVNAATDVDSTCFYARIHPKNAAKGMDILASMLLRPRLEGIETERRIISEEALEDLNEDGAVVSPDIVTGRMLWPDHPIGGATVGTLEDIDRISAGDLKTHLSNWYSPLNSVVTIAGPHDHEEMVKAVEASFGRWSLTEVPPTLQVPLLPADGPKTEFIRDADSQMTVQLACRSYRRDDPRITRLKVLRRVLAGGGCSRLHLALRERLGMVYSVDTAIGAYDETGCFSIDFATAPGNLNKVLGSTIEELERLCIESRPEQKELERVKTAYLSDLDYSRDSVSEMGARFGWGTLMGVVRNIEEEQEAIRDITWQHLQEAAKELFRPDNRYLAVIGPVEQIDQERVRRLTG